MAIDDPPKARGESHGWTDDEIAAMSRVRRRDIAEAADDWRDKAPERFAGLIDAEEAEPDDEFEMED